MRRFLSVFAVTAGLSIGPLAASAHAQTTFTACRVPAVGVIYMLNDAADPCLDAAHVKFSWTEGGAPADGSITTAKIANGAVTRAKLAPGAVEKVTRIEYSGSASQASTDPATILRTIGTFTKDNAATGITITWNSHSNHAGASFCEYELRVDGNPPTGATAYYGSIVYAQNEAMSQTQYWSGLSTGTHTISVWLRGFGQTCTENYLNFRPSVLVFER